MEDKKAKTEISTNLNTCIKQKNQYMENGFYIKITFGVKVGEAHCGDPRGSLQAPVCSFSFSDGGNGPKGAQVARG